MNRSAMHEKIHVNPRFLNPSQTVSQNVHFNPHFVGQSASRKHQNVSSSCLQNDPSASNVNILPPSSEAAYGLMPSHPVPQLNYLPTPPASLITGKNVVNIPPIDAPNRQIQSSTSNYYQQFNSLTTVNTSYSHSSPCCSTSVYESTSACHEVQHGSNVYYSSGSVPNHSQEHIRQANLLVPFRADNSSANSRPYGNLMVNSKSTVSGSFPSHHENSLANTNNKLSSSCQSQNKNHNVISVSKDSAKPVSIEPSSQSTKMGSNENNLPSSKLPSTYFINPKFIKKSQPSSASSECFLKSANNKDTKSILNFCTNASSQSMSGTIHKEELPQSAHANHFSSTTGTSCNLPKNLPLGPVKEEKNVLKNNPQVTDTSKGNYNGLFNEEARKDSNTDSSSVFVNPQFLKHSDSTMKQKVAELSSCALESPQSALARGISKPNPSIKSVFTYDLLNSAPKMISQTSGRSGAEVVSASQQKYSAALPGVVQENLSADASMIDISKNTWSISNLTERVKNDVQWSSGTRTSSESPAVYTNRNKLMSSQYAITKTCLIKAPGQMGNSNMVMKKELRPVMISTKNKLVRKRSSSSSFTGLSKQPNAGSSRINLSLKNKYCSTMSPKFQTQKYAFISRNKLVKSATNNLIRKKISPRKFQWCSKSSSKIVSYSKSSVELHGNGSSKVTPKIVSNYSTMGRNVNKKSDHFVRIGESMYKSTATSLKRQLPSRAVFTRGTPPTTSSPRPSGRRWHSGTSWSRCWVTDNKAQSTAMVFPSLHSFRISNTNYAQQHNKAYNLNVTKKRYYTPYGTLQQPTHAQRGLISALSITNKPKLSSSKRLALLAHAEKAQTLQRLIVAAKQRSVYILQRKAARKNTVLPMSMETQPRMADQKQRPSTQTDSSASISRSISVASGKSSGGNTKVPYCRFYHRFGRCFRGSACPYEHNPDRVAICTRFLRGRCHVPKCLFAHTLDKGRMPVCSHFLRDALCTRSKCPYLHVNPNPKAPICEDFLHGHCDKREKCKLQHVLECAEFRETGRCPREGRCPLPHPTRRPRPTVLRQNSSSSKKGRNKIKRSRTVSNGSGDGVLGAPATTKKRRETKQKKQVLARYFGSEESAPDDCSVTETPLDEGGAAAAVGSSEVHAQCRAQLNVKKQRIMSLIEKMKSRAGNNDSFTGAPASSAVGKVNTPLLNSGKYKIVDDEDVILVQPLLEYSADRSLPSFIPLSMTFCPGQPPLAIVRPPHLHVHPSLPLGSLEPSTPEARECITKPLASSSPYRKLYQQNKLEVSLQPRVSQTVTPPCVSSLPLSFSRISSPGSAVQLQSSVKLSINSNRTTFGSDTNNISTPTSSPSDSGTITVSSSQEVISGAGAPSELVLASSSHVSCSDPQSESGLCNDSTRSLAPVRLPVASTALPTSTVVDSQLKASMES